MAIEPLIERLGKSVQAAQATLRARFMSEIDKVSARLGHGSSTGLREELALLVDDFLSEMASTYEDFIATIEEELPDALAKPKIAKPRAKPKKQVDDTNAPPEPAFVKPTHVQKAINDGGMRISAEAKPRLMAMLNDAIKRDIDRIKEHLPALRSGSGDGETKRVTIRAEDVVKGILEAPAAPPATSPPGNGSTGEELELATIHVETSESPCKVVLVARKG